MQIDTILQGELTVDQDKCFAVVASRWHTTIVDTLVGSALDTLTAHGVKKGAVQVVYCPGAFEIPLTVKQLANRQAVDAIITLGAVIRGDTPHFEYIASTCANGIAQLNVELGIPIIFGVLTVDTLEQATERAGGKVGNKGEEAAHTALQMVNLLDAL